MTFVWRLGLAAVFAVLFCTGNASAAGVPPGWVGMMADGPLFAHGFDFSSQFQQMHEAGVQTVRVAFYWDQAQPYPSFDQVPQDEMGQFTDVEGVPTAFGFTDHVVAAAEAAHLRIMPVVLRTPPWATRDPGLSGSPPSWAGRVRLKRYLRALILRYRHGGAIHSIQIFNEPNMGYAWRTREPMAEYVRLLKSSYRAVKHADRKVKVVAAGLSAFCARALARMYQAGGKRYFDVAAVHPFRATVKGSIGVLRKARAVMRRHGDGRKPLLVSELSWTSARGRIANPTSIGTTEMGQANRLYHAIRKIYRRRKHLHIAGVYWSTWASREARQDDSFDWAGLRRVDSDGNYVDKPAMVAFKSAVRHIEK